MEKEIKIKVPEGYEIDKEKSSFEKIVFKKKKAINCWKDLKEISGHTINIDTNIIHWSGLTACAGNKNVFLNEKYAKSALALAQISQLLPYYDAKVNWDSFTNKYCIVRVHRGIAINILQGTYSILAFNTKEEAERFLKHNEQLVKDFFML